MDLMCAIVIKKTKIKIKRVSYDSTFCVILQEEMWKTILY